MAKVGKSLFCIAFSFMFLFITFGYAAFSDVMTVDGISVWLEPQTVYIRSVEVVATSGAVSSSSGEEILPTNVNTSITVGNNYAQKSVTYKITVTNNTNFKYAYTGIVYDSSVQNNNYLDNNRITITTKENQNDTGATFNAQDSIEAGETKTFYATYTMNWNVRNVTLTNLVNFKFGVHIDAVGDAAIENTLAKFLEVLNTEASYTTLITKIDDKYVNQDWQANYIGNVSSTVNENSQGASAKADIATIKELFGSDLSLTIDGVKTDVTVMIKRTNVDGNENTGDNYTATNGGYSTSATGCEMSIYLTSDKLNVSNGTAVVYLAVFTCERDANGDPIEWYQIGDIYKGKAPIVSYDGTGGGTGSFITDDWTSTATTYKVTENYSYYIGNGDGRGDGVEDIKEILDDTDNAANTEFLRLLKLAHGVLNGDYSDTPFGGEAVIALETAIAKSSSYYNTTTDANGNTTAGSVVGGTLRANIIPLMKDLEYALKAFESYLP